jgi:Zn-finger nucleic acid-binding protein
VAPARVPPAPGRGSARPGSWPWRVRVAARAWPRKPAHVATETGRSERQCPRCSPKGLTSLTAYLVGQTLLDQCGGCGGLWVDRTAFEQLVEAARMDQSALNGLGELQKSRGKVDASGQVSYVRCPDRDTVMNRQNYGKRSGVVVDACRDHGIWMLIDAMGQVARRCRIHRQGARGRRGALRRWRRKGARCDHASPSRRRQDRTLLRRPPRPNAHGTRSRRRGDGRERLARHGRADRRAWYRLRPAEHEKKGRTVLSLTPPVPPALCRRKDLVRLVDPARILDACRSTEVTHQRRESAASPRARRPAGGDGAVTGP